jgi:hypothetical protein
MTPEELAQQEPAVHDLVETLGQLSRHTQAAPDFLSQVLARVEALPTPRQRFRAWLPGVPVWPTTMTARLVSAYLLGVPADGV